MDIKELVREGRSIRAITRITGRSRQTVRKVLRGAHPIKTNPRKRVSKLEPYQEYVRKRFEDSQLSAVRLLEEIKPMGYAGSIQTLRRYLQTLKPERIRRAKITVRFETPPGKQAQADWGYCGKYDTPSGQRLAVYVFVIVLSYSRMMFIHFTTSMRMAALLESHQKAFAFFNGWPATVLYDNMKSVKRSRSQWNEQFLDFAHHYGFIPKTHQPYRPRTKGKVERMVEYVKDNFLAGRTFEGIEDVNAQALHWLNQTANVRVHSTTQAIPQERFAEEPLTPYDSIRPYRYLDPVTRQVNYESMLHYRGSRYSVPPAYAGQSVSVTAQGGHIRVQCGDTVIAEHPQALKGGQCIVNKDHIAELWKLTEQQVRPPQGPRWDITFQQSVQQVPLSVFEALTR
jgi:transposase